MMNVASNLRKKTEGISSSETPTKKAKKLKLVKSNVTSSSDMNSKVLIRKRKASQHPLRELRIRSGCTLEKLSEITKLSSSYLSRLESGSRRLNADIIQRLSLALACNPAELLPANVFSGTAYSKAPAPGVKDLPLYSITGKSGAEGVIKPSQTDECIARPADFVGIKDAFACTIVGDQWAPRYMKGDHLLLHPTAPLKADCAILLTTKAGQSFIGTFKGTTGAGASGSFNMETSFSKVVAAKSFNQHDISATYRITGALDPSL